MLGKGEEVFPACCSASVIDLCASRRCAAGRRAPCSHSDDCESRIGSGPRITKNRARIFSRDRTISKRISVVIGEKDMILFRDVEELQFEHAQFMLGARQFQQMWTC